jgi:hypothetical protein
MLLPVIGLLQRWLRVGVGIEWHCIISCITSLDRLQNLGLKWFAMPYLPFVKPIDLKTFTTFKKDVEEFGWPGFQLVGEEGADCTWLLVQHCDQDIEFQKQCLILLEKAVSRFSC